MKFTAKRLFAASVVGIAAGVTPIALTVALPVADSPVAATVQAPDTVQYTQSSGGSGSYVVKYVPGNSKISPTTQTLTGAGTCGTPTPPSSAAPILGLSAHKYSTTTYTDAAPSANVVGASKGRTGVCAIGQTWSIEPSEALDFSVGTNALVAGRLFTEAKLVVAKEAPSTSTVRLVEYLGSNQVCTYIVNGVTYGTGSPCQTASVPGNGDGNGDDTITVDTGVVASGFDRIEVQIPEPPSTSPASVAVISPTSTFTLGNDALSLVKSDTLNPAKYDHVGQVIGYTLTATNTGFGPLQNVVVSDSPALASFSCTPSVPDVSLAVGASVVCTGSHTVTQSDLDTGHLTDTGSATSTQANATPATDTVYATQTPHLSLSAASTEASFSGSGQTIHYTLTATNDGNVTLSGVRISDTTLGVLVCTPTQPATLAPSATLTCTGTYTTTASDVVTGTLTNNSSVTGTPPSGSTVTSVTNTATTSIGAAKLTLVKTDSLNSMNPPGTYSAPGQVITYTVTATNSGNVTLHDVVVNDTPTPADYSCSPATPASLVAGASVTCAGTHTVTLADLSAGSITDTASASSDEASATDAPDTVHAKETQICGGDTIGTTGSDGVATDGTVSASVELLGAPNENNCKDYSFFGASASTTNGDEVDFLSQQVHDAHVTATFTWGYVGSCDPNAPGDLSGATPCPITYVDFGLGLQPQTFCAAADPNGVSPWCTTSRSYTDVIVDGVTVTQITETWDGYGDISFHYH